MKRFAVALVAVAAAATAQETRPMHHATGTFAVTVQATTPDGLQLGQEVTLSVRSTAYGGLALGITGLAFAVLVLAVLLRLYRRWRARDTQPPVAAGSPADRIGG